MKRAPASPKDRSRRGGAGAKPKRPPRAAFTLRTVTGRWARALRRGGLRTPGGVRLAWRP